MKVKQVLDSVDSGSISDLLGSLYHQEGLGRKPYNPVSVLKAQLLKHLLRIPSDRRLALRLKHDRKAAKACGFRKHTPCHSLFTHYRHRLSEETYQHIFNQLLGRLLEKGVMKGKVVAVNSTHIQAYSQRNLDNRTGKSDRRPGGARKERLHTRIPCAHSLLHPVRATHRLHRGSVQRER